MRPPLRRLKAHPAPADHPTMALGGWSRHRRAVLGLSIVAALAMGLVGSPVQAQRAPASDRSEGSGVPSGPVLYPREVAGRAKQVKVVFSDLDASDAWAKEAIRWVAGTNDWMRDYASSSDGTYRFKPDAFATRKYVARSIVKAFAPDIEPDPSVVFTDLDPSSPWYRYAAVASDYGWMRPDPDGAFLPDERVSTAEVHRALVLALGLRQAARALDRMHTRDGDTFDTPRDFGTTMLGLRLELRYNFPSGSESKEVTPADDLRRAYVAYSLWRATTQPAYTISDLLEQYADVELPHLGPRKLAIVRWGVRFIGYPYYWGGEWGLEAGPQEQPGFDCSGLTWWLLRKNDGGWRVAPPRPYRGWALPERSSAQMASGTDDRLRFKDLRPGDMMFYDGDRDGVVDHVDTYIGNGYALDSSSTPGGVTVMWVGDGWYREHFRFGRRVIGR